MTTEFKALAVALAIGVAAALGWIASRIEDTTRVYIVDPSITATTTEPAS